MKNVTIMIGKDHFGEFAIEAQLSKITKLDEGLEVLVRRVARSSNPAYLNLIVEHDELEFFELINRTKLRFEEWNRANTRDELSAMRNGVWFVPITAEAIEEAWNNE